MEKVVIKIDDGSGSEYDEEIRGCLAEGADLTFTSKDKCTVNGKAGVVITFTAYLDDNTPVKVQAVSTMANFMAVGRGFAAIYDDSGKRR